MTASLLSIQRLLQALPRAFDRADAKCLHAVDGERLVGIFAFDMLQKPPYYSPGAASETMVYVEDHAAAWHGTVGAVDWLRAQLPAPKKRAPRKADGRTLH